VKFKATFVLLAVFAVLLALVLVFESKGKKAVAAKEQEGLLVNLAPADIRKIELKKEGGAIVLEKDDKGGWQLTAPLDARADGSEADGLASSFASLRIDRVVEKEAKDLKTYGIPQREVSLWVKGKYAPVRVHIGMENPLDKSLFAKREDDPRVVLVPSDLKSTLDKKVFDFREKTIFKFDTADVKGIRVRAKDVSWEAARTADGWLFKAPFRALANKSQLDTLLDSLSNLRATEFVSEEKKLADVKKFGLEKPEYEVALAMSAAGREVVYSLHKDGDKSYALTSRSNEIIAFDGSLLADLGKKADELREKKVTDFSSWEANKICVKKGDFRLTAAKEKVKDEETWLLDTAGKDTADGTKIEAFIRNIEGLEAAAFIDNPKSLAAYGLDQPAAEIIIWTKDIDNKVKETSLLVGNENRDKKQVVVKNRKLDGLFRVDASFLQDFPKDAKDWKAEPPKTQETTTDKKK
jgi:uncharacterized protein YpmB